MNFRVKEFINTLKLGNYKGLFLLITLVFFVIETYAQTKDIEYKTTAKTKEDIRNKIEFSTLDYESGLYTVKVSTTGSNSKYIARLKYRVDNQKWNDLLDSRGRRIEHANYKRKNSSTYNVLLDKDLLDKKKVEIGWEVILIRKRGRLPVFNFQSLSLKGEYDKYKGVPSEVILFRKPVDDYILMRDNIIEFNHIPFPFTFAPTQRIWIKAKYLRDNINLKFTTKDSIHFSIDTRSFIIDSLGEKIITISYNPKSIGRHKTELKISTPKLNSDIILNLSGSCDSRQDFNVNNFEQEVRALKNGSNYRFPVFSNMSYQFRFDYFERELLDKDISFRYRWYKDEELLLEMKDELKSNFNPKNKNKKNEPITHCFPLVSPAFANGLEISVFTNGGNLDIEDIYFGTPKLKKLIASGNWSDANNWSPKGSPSIEDFVSISPGLKVKVSEDVYCATLILGDSSNVEIEANKMFYVSGDIYYGKKSWFIVHQDLPENKWIYTSSPVNNTKALIYSMRKDNNETWLMEYNTGVKSEMNDYWSDYIVDPNYKIIPGKGYAVLSKKPLDVIYEGILNDAQVTYPLVYSKEDSWNLVGNPYTAPLSSRKLFSDIDGKIQGNVIFLFDSKNDVYNPVIIDGKEEVVIPSLQGFFVEALKTNSEMIFKRSQQYIPKSSSYSWTNHNYLTLNISNGEKEEYIIMGMIDDASYGFDKYDAHKLFGSSKDTPEIYFLKDDEELSVNVFPNYPAIYDLGVYVGKDSDLELNLGNFSVLPDNIQVFIHDKKTNTYSSLCNEKSYNFSIKKGSTDERFRVLLLKGINIPELNGENSGIYVWTDKGEVNIYSDSYHNLHSIRVWDKANMLVYEQDYTKGVNRLDYKFPKGVYNLELEIGDNWIKGFIIEIK